MKKASPSKSGRSRDHHRGLVLGLTLGLASQCLWRWTGLGWTLAGSVLLALGLFLLLQRIPRIGGREPSLSPALQGGLFTAILALAFFLRAIHLRTQPPGLYIDPGFIGWGALRILHEGWRPFGTQPILLTWPTILYQCAAWFTVFKPGLASLSLFFTTLALAAFPFFYLFFRRLSGAPTALLTLFFMAVMYWHLHACRGELTGNQVYLYEGLVLWLWLFGLETSRKWALGAAGAILALGIYGYQSFKFFPFVVLALFLYEYRTDTRRWRRMGTGWTFLVLAALAVGLPFLLEMAHRGMVSDRERVFFIGTAVLEQKSLAPLWDSLSRTLLLFNRQGDPLPSGTPGGLPLLDPILGFLFLTGLFLALRTPWERRNFYALAVFFLGLLPAILSLGDGSHRILGVIPFVAYFGARACVEILGSLGKGSRKPWLALGFYLLAVAALWNAKTYFLDQPKDPSYDTERSVDATRVALAVLENPDTEFYLPHFYYEHYTVRFLTYGQGDRVRSGGPPLGPASPLTGHPETCFVLREGKGGWAGFLRTLYPVRMEQMLRGTFGEPLASLHFVPTASLPKASWDRGLLLEFSCPELPQPFQRWDPLLNITDTGDLPYPAASFDASWTGQLVCPAAGVYELKLLTNETGALFVDGKAVGDPVFLKKGGHALRATLSRHRRENRVNLDCHLIWKKPGGTGFEVVPAQAFGKTHPLPAAPGERRPE